MWSTYAQQTSWRWFSNLVSLSANAASWNKPSLQSSTDHGKSGRPNSCQVQAFFKLSEHIRQRACSKILRWYLVIVHRWRRHMLERRYIFLYCSAVSLIALFSMTFHIKAPSSELFQRICLVFVFFLLVEDWQIDLDNPFPFDIYIAWSICNARGSQWSHSRSWLQLLCFFVAENTEDDLNFQSDFSLSFFGILPFSRTVSVNRASWSVSFALSFLCCVRFKRTFSAFWPRAFRRPRVAFLVFFLHSFRRVSLLTAPSAKSTRSVVDDDARGCR